MVREESLPSCGDETWLTACDISPDGLEKPHQVRDQRHAFAVLRVGGTPGVSGKEAQMPRTGQVVVVQTALSHAAGSPTPAPPWLAHGRST